MNLKELRNHIMGLQSYAPENSQYEDFLTRSINECYFELAAMHQWSWCIREAPLTLYADEQNAQLTLTNGSKVVTTGGTFKSWMAGNILLAPDGNEYIVESIESNVSLTLARVYAGTTGIGTGTFYQRYIDLPSDCIAALSLYDLENQTVLFEADRYEEDWLIQDRNSAGTPFLYVKADEYRVSSPLQAPTLSTTGIGTLTAGTYEVVFTYYHQNKYSAPSASASITLTGAQNLVITLPNTTTGLNQKKAVWIKFTNTAGTVKYKAYRLQSTDIAAVTTTVTITTPLEASFLLDSRLPNNDGVYQRIRLQYRQDEDKEWRLRYLYRPARLIEDSDVPELPTDYQIYLAYRVLSDNYISHDQPTLGDRYSRKYLVLLQQMRTRYLRNHNRIFLKAERQTGLYPYIVSRNSGQLIHP